jgi:hypothetical protein
MTLGYALLIVFILWLIDKHNLWRLTLKVAVGLIVLAVLGFGGFYGWSKYTEYKNQQALAAQGAAYKAEFDACVRRIDAVTKKWGFAVCTYNHAAQAVNYKNLPDDAYLTQFGEVVIPSATGFIPLEPPKGFVPVPKVRKPKSEWVDVPEPSPTFHYANEKESFGHVDSVFGDDSKSRYISKAAFCNADNRKVGDILIAIAPNKTDYWITFVFGDGHAPRVQDYETPEQKIAAGDKIAAETFNKACKAAQ